MFLISFIIADILCLIVESVYALGLDDLLRRHWNIFLPFFASLPIVALLECNLRSMGCGITSVRPGNLAEKAYLLLCVAGRHFTRLRMNPGVFWTSTGIVLALLLNVITATQLDLLPICDSILFFQVLCLILSVIWYGASELGWTEIKPQPEGASIEQ